MLPFQGLPLKPFEILWPAGITGLEKKFMIWIAPSNKNTDTAALMAEQILTLQRQTHHLRRTRDLLLPRLLSGQVNVT